MLRMKSEMWQKRYKEAKLDDETKKEIERIESRYVELSDMENYQERKEWLEKMTLEQLKEYYKSNHNPINKSDTTVSPYLTRSKARLIDAILFAKNFDDRHVCQIIAFSDDRYFGGF